MKKLLIKIILCLYLNIVNATTFNNPSNEIKKQAIKKVHFEEKESQLNMENKLASYFKNIDLENTNIGDNNQKRSCLVKTLYYKISNLFQGMDIKKRSEFFPDGVENILSKVRKIDIETKRNLMVFSNELKAILAVSIRGEALREIYKFLLEAKEGIFISINRMCRASEELKRAFSIHLQKSGIKVQNSELNTGGEVKFDPSYKKSFEEKEIAREKNQLKNNINMRAKKKKKVSSCDLINLYTGINYSANKEIDSCQSSSYNQNKKKFFNQIHQANCDGTLENKEKELSKEEEDIIYRGICGQNKKIEFQSNNTIVRKKQSYTSIVKRKVNNIEHSNFSSTFKSKNSKKTNFEKRKKAKKNNKKPITGTVVGSRGNRTRNSNASINQKRTYKNKKHSRKKPIIKNNQTNIGIEKSNNSEQEKPKDFDPNLLSLDSGISSERTQKISPSPEPVNIISEKKEKEILVEEKQKTKKISKVIRGRKKTTYSSVNNKELNKNPKNKSRIVSKNKKSSVVKRKKELEAKRNNFNKKRAAKKRVGTYKRKKTSRLTRGRNKTIFSSFKCKQYKKYSRKKPIIKNAQTNIGIEKSNNSEQEKTKDFDNNLLNLNSVIISEETQKISPSPAPIDIISENKETEFLVGEKQRVKSTINNVVNKNKQNISNIVLSSKITQAINTIDNVVREFVESNYLNELINKPNLSHLLRRVTNGYMYPLYMEILKSSSKQEYEITLKLIFKKIKDIYIKNIFLDLSAKTILEKKKCLNQVSLFIEDIEKEINTFIPKYKRAIYTSEFIKLTNSSGGILTTPVKRKLYIIFNIATEEFKPNHGIYRVKISKVLEKIFAIKNYSIAKEESKEYDYECFLEEVGAYLFKLFNSHKDFEIDSKLIIRYVKVQLFFLIYAKGLSVATIKTDKYIKYIYPEGLSNYKNRDWLENMVYDIIIGNLKTFLLKGKVAFILKANCEEKKFMEIKNELSRYFRSTIKRAREDLNIDNMVSPTEVDGCVYLEKLFFCPNKRLLPYSVNDEISRTRVIVENLSFYIINRYIFDIGTRYQLDYEVAGKIATDVVETAKHIKDFKIIEYLIREQLPYHLMELTHDNIISLLLTPTMFTECNIRMEKESLNRIIQYLNIVVNSYILFYIAKEDNTIICGDEVENFLKILTNEIDIRPSLSNEERNDKNRFFEINKNLSYPKSISIFVTETNNYIMGEF